MARGGQDSPGDATGVARRALIKSAVMLAATAAAPASAAERAGSGRPATAVVAGADSAVVEIASGRIAGFVRNGVVAFKGVPYGDEKCGNCLYYLNPDDKLAYCWHPKLRILVGAEWWCQWWEKTED